MVTVKFFQASELLRDYRMRQLGLKYRLSLTPERKKQFEDKVLAEFLFKGKKKTYRRSIPEWFKKDRLQPEQHQLIETFKNQLNGEKILVSSKGTSKNFFKKI